MTTTSLPQQAANKLKDLFPNAKPRVGIVLGSGLGKLTDALEDKKSISYTELPGFPHTSVDGHGGNLILGRYHDTEVVCLEGRAHTYESGSYEDVKTYVRTLKCLGCEYFLATNASGSLRIDVGPGELVLVTDHINFQGGNPLVGPNDDEFGPRFPPMDDTYCVKLRKQLKAKASALGIRLHEGVYISVLGPSYETAAEIKAFRTLGADVIGMSTVPEVIVANHCGLKIAVIATVTNYATDLAQESHCHSDVVNVADKASTRLQTLIKAFINDL